MKRTYRKVLKHYFNTHPDRVRTGNELTQTVMAERSPMVNRSRLDLKHRTRWLRHAASYRIPRPVVQIVQYSSRSLIFPVCPRCKRSMEREYASFCDRCGQKLNWDKFDDAEILIGHIPK